MAGVSEDTLTRKPSADPGEHLFDAVLVDSQRGPKSGWQKHGGRVSILLHLVALAALVFVPIFTPPELPSHPDLFVKLIYDPPPPPPPPLPKGSPLRPQQVKPEVPKPVVRTPPKDQLTAPIQVPQPKENDKIQPEQGVRPEDQFGSEHGSDLGDALGMEEGVEGGVLGGVPGGVIGGVIGGTGTGPVLDYDSPPRVVKQTKPAYPQEAFVKKIEGTVDLEILIDAQGRVIRARVIRSVPLLDQAAIQTVLQWVFLPAIKAGHPVPTIARAPVSFRIY